ncbi:MAG: hypothetical protein K5780_02585 [Alphaproteobacteria bacterium]|nr:hypothetical protein [Alphaproteobacteria bacterium]
MKKTIFVGISLLSISICIDEVWGLLNSRVGSSNRRNSTGNITRGMSTRGSMFENRRNNTGNITGGMNTRGSVFENRYNSGNTRDILSDIILEKTVLDELKDIIDEIPSKNIRFLQRNMRYLSISLPRGNGVNDVQMIINKINGALNCLEDLLSIRNNLYFELFNRTERIENLPDDVELNGIIEDFGRIDMARLGKIISICEKERSLESITANLRKFSNRIKESKNFLEDINQRFSQILISQIEGNPERKNLELANTPENRRLGKIRDDNEEQNAFDDVPSPYDASSSQGPSTQQPGTEGNSGNTVPQSTPGTENNTNNATNSQPTPVQQSVGQSATESSSANAAVAQVASVPQNTVQTTDVSNSNATTPGVSGQPQNTEQQPVSDNSSQVSTQQSANNATTNVLASQGDSSNNVTNSQPTPVQQSVGQTTTESSPTNAAVAQVASAPQNTVQSTVGDSSNNATSTQQPANSAAPQGQNSGTEGSAGNAAIPQGITTQSTENNTNNAPIPQGDSSNNAMNSQPTSTQTGQQPGTEGSSGNATPQPNTGQTAEESSPSTSTQVTPAQQSIELPTTASNFQVNIINRENPKKFYVSLEQNVKFLKDEDLNNEKKKAAYDRICKYLEEAKLERSFEQRVSDAQRIINAYNSLTILIPQKLKAVPRQKIKSLRETIYSEVFDDLKLRMEKLKSDDRFKNYEKDIDNFIKLNERNKSDFFDNDFFNAFFKEIKENQDINFAKFLKSKGKETESFEAITSDRKNRAGRNDQFSSALMYDDKKAMSVIGIYRRGLMSASVDAYDQLIRKIWNETGVDYKVVDLVGPVLHDGVILSIDVN